MGLWPSLQALVFNAEWSWGWHRYLYSGNEHHVSFVCVSSFELVLAVLPHCHFGCVDDKFNPRKWSEWTDQSFCRLICFLCTAALLKIVNVLHVALSMLFFSFNGKLWELFSLLRKHLCFPRAMARLTANFKVDFSFAGAFVEQVKLYQKHMVLNSNVVSLP